MNIITINNIFIIIMDELITKLNKLDINKEICDESIDDICDSLNSMCKISDDEIINVKQQDIIHVVNIISKIPLGEHQIKKLDNIGLLISNLLRKIKCYEFTDAYTIPKYVY
jgi:CHASE3 domain sensor protein